MYGVCARRAAIFFGAFQFSNVSCLPAFSFILTIDMVRCIDFHVKSTQKPSHLNESTLFTYCSKADVIHSFNCNSERNNLKFYWIFHCFWLVKIRTTSDLVFLIKILDVLLFPINRCIIDFFSQNNNYLEKLF